uniref:Uncharacterized protein n=1 Tax=Amphimedon queenslandica TaxID=400682 RepID=A0A1X7VHT4_AMPQE
MYWLGLSSTVNPCLTGALTKNGVVNRVIYVILTDGTDTFGFLAWFLWDLFLKQRLWEPDEWPWDICERYGGRPGVKLTRIGGRCDSRVRLAGETAWWRDLAKELCMASRERQLKQS